MIVSATMNTIAGRISRNMMFLLRPIFSSQVQGVDHEVDRLDADEWNNDAANAVNQQIAAQQRARADRTERDALQCQRNEGDDDQRIEDDGRQNRALRARQVHNVERLELRAEQDETT